jgi:hypothetical protein
MGGRACALLLAAIATAGTAACAAAEGAGGGGGGTFIVTTLDGRAAAIDATTGALRWRLDTGGPLLDSFPRPADAARRGSDAPLLIPARDGGILVASPPTSTPPAGAGRSGDEGSGGLLAAPAAPRLHILPYRAQDLTPRLPLVAPGGALLVGDSTSTLLEIDLETGTLTERFGGEGRAPRGRGARGGADPSVTDGEGGEASDDDEADEEREDGPDGGADESIIPLHPSLSGGRDDARSRAPRASSPRRTIWLGRTDHRIAAHASPEVASAFHGERWDDAEAATYEEAERAGGVDFEALPLWNLSFSVLAPPATMLATDGAPPAAPIAGAGVGSPRSVAPRLPPLSLTASLEGELLATSRASGSFAWTTGSLGAPIVGIYYAPPPPRTAPSKAAADGSAASPRRGSGLVALLPIPFAELWPVAEEEEEEEEEGGGEGGGSAGGAGGGAGGGGALAAAAGSGSAGGPSSSGRAATAEMFLGMLPGGQPFAAAPVGETVRMRVPPPRPSLAGGGSGGRGDPLLLPRPDDEGAGAVCGSGEGSSCGSGVDGGSGLCALVDASGGAASTALTLAAGRAPFAGEASSSLALAGMCAAGGV